MNEELLMKYNFVKSNDTDKYSIYTILIDNHKYELEVVYFKPNNEYELRFYKIDSCICRMVYSMWNINEEDLIYSKNYLNNKYNLTL